MSEPKSTTAPDFTMWNAPANARCDALDQLSVLGDSAPPSIPRDIAARVQEAGRPYDTDAPAEALRRISK